MAFKSTLLSIVLGPLESYMISDIHSVEVNSA